MNCDQVFSVLTRGPFPTGAEDDVHVETHLSGCYACRRIADALRPDLASDPVMAEIKEADGLPFYRGLGALRRAEEARAAAAEEERAHPERSVVRPARPSFVSNLPAPKAEPTYGGLGLWQLAIAVVLGAAMGTLLKVTGVFDEQPRPLQAKNDFGPPPIAAFQPATERYDRQVEPAAFVEPDRFERDENDFDVRWQRQRASDRARRTRDREVVRILVAKLGALPVCWREQEPADLSSNDDIDVTPYLAGGENGPDLAHFATVALADQSERCCTRCHNSSSPRLQSATSASKIARSCQACHRDVDDR